MTNSTTDVAIIMGSDSDLPIVEASFAILDSFGVKYTKNVMSAHRTPHEVMELIKTSENNGCKVFIESRGHTVLQPPSCNDPANRGERCGRPGDTSTSPGARHCPDKRRFGEPLPGCDRATVRFDRPHR